MTTTDATAPGPGRDDRGISGGLKTVRPGDTLGGRFLLRQVLGCGATGTVFAALDTSVGQKVAVKLLHPELRDDMTRERLRREVRAARAGHPNLVSVYDLHETDGHVYLSMELVEGTSLKDHLAERSPLTTAEVASIGREVASGLAHLHDHGLVHRDVKPGNILLARDGSAKLCDMGLTRPLEQGMTITGTEVVVGTPAYMAPEQGLGAGLTAASDVYGLGMTLYQCLTGSVPLTSENAVATLTRRQRERPPAPRRSRGDCPRWLDRLLRRMLEPRPTERPSARRVERVLGTARMWPRPRRRTLAAAAGAAAVAAVAVLAFPWILARDTVEFRVDGAEVLGLDADGRPTWTHQLPAPPISRAVEADLDGDGVNELIVAGGPPDYPSAQPNDQGASYVVALNTRGEVLTSLVPEDLITSWDYPFRIRLTSIPFALDLDGDRWHEIVLQCRHTHFYPTVVVIFWPRWNRWELTLSHPGHLTAFAAGSADNRPGLRFTGVNNLLAFTPVFGEIELVPPGSRRGQNPFIAALTAPPQGLLAAGTVGTWRLYVPLDEPLLARSVLGDRIVAHDDGSIDFCTDNETTFRLDRFGNPSPGPNQGSDLKDLRRNFMDNLYRLHRRSSPITPKGVDALLQGSRSAAGPLLAEAPYEIILSVVGARALASAGDVQAALQTVRAAAYLNDEDLIFLQAHIEAIAGEMAEARDTALRLIDIGVSARSHYDGLFLLLEIGAASRDRGLVEMVVERAARESFRREHQQALQSSLGARARLWWDECTPTDSGVRASSLVPDGDALGCLSRWRQNRLAADDLEAMKRAIELNPGGAGLAWTALAAVHLERSEAGEALEAIETGILELESPARYDFVAHQDLMLARALRAVALDAAGDRAGAVRAARDLSGSLDPRLLPGILLAEVLDRQPE